VTRAILCSIGAWAALATPWAPASPQAIRITGATTFQYLDVRPLEDDSIATTDAIGTGLIRQSPDGYAVRCVGNDPFCRYRRAGSSTATVPAIQDLSINVWGFARGVRIYSRLRGRAMVVGDEALWPRADDVFDVMAAFVEVNRSAFRGRAGRLWRASGLGYYNYDGASLAVFPSRVFSAEAYGGWSLARGLNEPVTSQDLAAVEPFPPDTRSYLLGAQVTVRPRSGTSLTAMYQREIRTDRLALYSERIAVDAVARAGATTFDGVLKLDLATTEVNEGRVRFWLPRLGPVAVNAYARHYRPYFDLWTIWGAFTPLGFDEIGTSASWHRMGHPVTVEIFAAGRRYGPEQTDDLFGDFRTTGWRLGGTVSGTVSSQWHVNGQYQAEIGFGAARSEGSIRVQRDLTEGNYIAVTGSAFQRLYEFRVDDATVFGLGADVGLRRGTSTRLVGNITMYRHTGSGVAINDDWTQIRGSIRVEWTVGVEPALRTAPGGVP